MIVVSDYDAMTSKKGKEGKVDKMTEEKESLRDATAVLFKINLEDIASLLDMPDRQETELLQSPSRWSQISTSSLEVVFQTDQSSISKTDQSSSSKTDQSSSRKTDQSSSSKTDQNSNCQTDQDSSSQTDQKSRSQTYQKSKVQANQNSSSDSDSETSLSDLDGYDADISNLHSDDI